MWTRPQTICCSRCSVAQLCPTLCDSMNCSTPGFPVLDHLPGLAQTHVHWVSDVIEPSHPLSFLASGYFPMSLLFASGGQSIGASASVLAMDIQGWFPLELTGLISLLSKGTLKSLLQHHNMKASILWRSAFFMVQLSHLYRITGKTIALTIWTFVTKVISLKYADMRCTLEGKWQVFLMEWVLGEEEEGKQDNTQLSAWSG